MTREEAKELLPIIQAFAEGKEIEYFSNGGIWEDCINPGFYAHVKYRIKQDIKYRPFRNIEECWKEMDKHEPFGWLKDKTGGDLIVITALKDDDIAIGRHNGWDYAGLMREFSFADGTPFGIEEDV